MNIALPSAQADLGFSDGDRQWVITAYALAFASLLLLGGRLSDLWGRKRTFIIGLVGFALASALGGAAPTFEVLIGARALQGVFGALLAPTALAVLTTTFTIPKERARAFGVFGAIAGAGGAVGLLLGGCLTENLDWRWNLYINVAIAAVAIVGTVLFVPSIERTGPRPKLDIPGTLLVSGGLFGIVYGFSNAETDGWDSPLTWGVLAVAAVLLVAFVFWQTRAKHPLLPLSIVLDRNRGAAFFSVLVAGAGMFGVFLFVTYYLQISLGFSPMRDRPGVPADDRDARARRAAVDQPAAAATRPEGHGAGRHVVRRRSRWCCSPGSTSTAAMRPTCWLPLMVLGLAMGTIMPASMQTATLGVDRQFAGVASAMVNTSQQVGGSIGTALLNTIAATAATDYIANHLPPSDLVVAEAAVTVLRRRVLVGRRVLRGRRRSRRAAVPPPG